MTGSSNPQNYLIKGKNEKSWFGMKIWKSNFTFFQKYHHIFLQPQLNLSSVISWLPIHVSARTDASHPTLSRLYLLLSDNHEHKRSNNKDLVRLYLTCRKYVYSPRWAEMPQNFFLKLLKWKWWEIVKHVKKMDWFGKN